MIACAGLSGELPGRGGGGLGGMKCIGCGQDGAGYQLRRCLVCRFLESRLGSGTSPVGGSRVVEQALVRSWLADFDFSRVLE